MSEDARPLEGYQSPYRAGELLQTAATVSAIALALATLTNERGPVIDGYHPLPLIFLYAGFFALVGSLYAMVEVWIEVGLSPRLLLGIDVPTFGASALIVTTWGLSLTGSPTFGS
ncbi:MAG: hypothetical protein H0W06_09900 [Chloroflexia bacterium]|nr:hypothetical protein [Chloroflexia bacterium]